jgi:ArsR family transcriptional regulator
MSELQSCCGGLAKWLDPQVFKALADPMRIAILARVGQSGQELTVREVAECCPIDLSVVSRHLRMLREAGVVTARKQGKHVFYRLNAAELARVFRSLADAVESCCGSGGPGETP